MYIFLTLIMLAVSLAAYAGVVTLHEAISDARYRAARVTPIITPSVSRWSWFFSTNEVAIRHPKDARVRRTGGQSYISRHN